MDLGTQGLEKVPENGDLSLISLGLDLFEETHPGKPRIDLQTRFEIVLVGIQLRGSGPTRGRPWTLILPQGFANGIAGDPQLSDNPLNAIALFIQTANIHPLLQRYHPGLLG
jgi:hypothetical protein